MVSPAALTAVLCLIGVPAVVLSAVVLLVVLTAGVLTLLTLSRNRADFHDPVHCKPGYQVQKGRLAPHLEGDFVVVLIGAGVNSWWSLPHIFFTGSSMQAMVEELKADPASGFLGGMSFLGNPTIMVQYWRSMEQLHTFARKPKGTHSKVWGKFNRHLAEAARGLHSDGGVGIWHEAYLVKDGNYEGIYGDMPPFGLGRFTELHPCTGMRATAAGRLKQKHNAEKPVQAEIA